MNIVDELVAQPTRRDRWGRYVVLSPEGKLLGYTRATTIAKTLDDSGGLLGWGKRMVAIGLGRRPDLVGLIAATDSNDKKALDELCERAAEAGGSTVRRDQGIALHAALEQAWHDPEAAPGMFLEDVRAVHRALEAAGLRPVPEMAERIVVNDKYQVAGTFDLVLTDGETNYVADVKTGSSLLGALAFSIQLAIYANADNLYVQGAAKDGSEDERQPMPELDRNHGVILHVQPNSAVCDLHWIDLATGADALRLAYEVRSMRKIKVLSPVEAAEPKVTPEAAVMERLMDAFPGAEEVVGEEWRGWFRTRLADIIEAGHGDDLKAAWPYGIPTLRSGESITLSQAAELENVVSAIEKMFTLPFPAPKPRTQEKQPEQQVSEWISRIDKREVFIEEGRAITEEDARSVAVEIAELDADAKAFVSETQKAATAVKRNFRMGGKGGQLTERRLSIAQALVDLAGRDEKERSAIVSKALGRVVGGTPDELGPVLGSLTIDQADALHDVLVGVEAALFIEQPAA